MLDVGGFRARHCQGVGRRAFLTAGLAAPLAAALTASRTTGTDDRRRAKSVILLWLWGAPSHLDTFDPKPNAPAEYRGPFGTIPTRIPGVRFTELFPRTAARSDRLALVRSHKTSDGDHLKAGTIGLTGAAETAAGVQPNFGSVAARHLGMKDLPSFVAVGRGHPRDVVGTVKGYGGGNWGRTHDPLLVGCSATGETDVPALKLLDGLTPAHLDDRRELLRAIDDQVRAGDRGTPDRWDESKRRAYALLTSPDARGALDLSRETPAVRDAYGHTSFGQSCLLARRLVEAGVPFVQVNWSQYVEAMTPNCDFGWDTHIYNFDMLADRHGPIFDRVYPALLDDLKERGLLDTTLVVAMGEFGRTPKINGQASRDHWPQCYFSLWAGAGVRPGRVVGESDRVGGDPITEPLPPAAVGATMLECLGIDTQARAELRVLPEARVIHELF